MSKKKTFRQHFFLDKNRVLHRSRFISIEYDGIESDPIPEGTEAKDIDAVIRRLRSHKHQRDALSR